MKQVDYTIKVHIDITTTGLLREEVEDRVLRAIEAVIDAAMEERIPTAVARSEREAHMVGGYELTTAIVEAATLDELGITVVEQ